LGGTAVLGAARNANGTYTDDLVAVTGNNQLGIQATVGVFTGDIDNVSIQLVQGPFTGPSDGDLWQADIFGTLMIFTNINDPPQKIDIDANPPVLSPLGGVPGGYPPQAKFIETVGDFVFLAYLKEGGIEYPKRAQHSRLNDAEDWLIDGQEGSSDRIECPDGDEIMGIFSRPGGAMIMQRRYKRRLTFSPGTPTAFTMTDLDPTRGAVAPNAVVPIGGGNYIYLNETGWYMGDDHQAIGSEQMDRSFLKDVNPDKISWVQGVNDALNRIVWFRYQDGSDTYKMIGYDWELGNWLASDARVQYLMTTTTVAGEMDDFAVPMDTYVDSKGAGIPMDSLSFKGGRVNLGAFKEDHVLYQFSGAPMEAQAELPTGQLIEGQGAFVRATQLLGDVPAYSISVGSSTLPDQAIDWKSVSSRSLRTGKCPHRVDGKYHRFRVTIPAGTPWTIAHGLQPTFEPSGEA
jgi:hypothetical protein